MQTGGQKRETKRIIYFFKRVEMGEGGKRGIIEVLWEGRISLSGEERCGSECVRKNSSLLLCERAAR